MAREGREKSKMAARGYQPEVIEPVMLYTEVY